jgi:hypothetical protein
MDRYLQIVDGYNSIQCIYPAAVRLENLLGDFLAAQSAANVVQRRRAVRSFVIQCMAGCASILEQHPAVGSIAGGFERRV